MTVWRVLVIEDDTDSRLLLVSLLTLHQYRVVDVASGAEGLGLLEQQAFDIVYCDIQMPEVSGWDVIHSIRHHLNPRVAQTLVLAVSGHIADQVKVESAGFDGLLCKPIDVVKFHHQALLVLDRWRREHFLSTSD